MKKEYPNYKNITLEQVYDKQTQRNKKLLNDFVDYCKITASDNSIKKIYGKIVQIADIINKPLDTLTLQDIRGFLVLLNNSSRAISTKNDTKKILKRFLKWRYKNWSSRFEDLKDARASSNEQRKLSKEDLLTPDEMKILINGVDSLKYKTILLILQETASRPEEVMKLKWKDCNLTTKEIKLDSSKTGKQRHIPLNESSNHLERYKAECFYDTPRNEDYVFPNPRDNEKHLTTQALNNFLLALERRLKFKKHLYPYLWRHSILSRLIKKLSPKVYEMYSGHSLETGMKVYAHLDTEDLKEELYEKVYQIKELLPQEKEEIKKLKQKVKDFEEKIQKFPAYFEKEFAKKIKKMVEDSLPTR